MSRAELEVHPIPVRGASPWTFRARVGLLLWDFAWPLLCRWTPKPFNPWRLFWLRVFGCRITGTPFVHQRARIQIPWHVTLNHLSNVGDRTNLYSLGEIELGPKCVVAQEVYLCTGTHDFQDPTTPLATAKITIGTDAFVGARTFVMPGVTIGNRAVVGACSLVTRNVEPETVVAGSPARFLRFKESPYLDTVEKT